MAGKIGAVFFLITALAFASCGRKEAKIIYADYNTVAYSIDGHIIEESFAEPEHAEIYKRYLHMRYKIIP